MNYYEGVTIGATAISAELWDFLHPMLATADSLVPEVLELSNGKTDLTIKKVIFNPPATIVYWGDGTKTIVKCQEGDVYSKETGLALAIVKKVYGNNGDYNDIFRKWIAD